MKYISSWFMLSMLVRWEKIQIP